MALTDPFLIAADLFDPAPDPYASDPVGWCFDILGVELWSRQRDIIQSVRDYRQTAVRSGNGVGKTLTAAATVLWFLDTHLDSRAITTATKWDQVEKLLWHEVGQLHAKACDRPQAAGRPIFRVGKGQPLKTEIHLPDGRYGIGLSSKPENSESFAGHHAPHILVVYDEASGVHPSIFEVGDGYLTTAGAKVLMIGNPTRASGVFFDAFHSHRAEYNTLHISVLESPPITGEAVSERALAALSGNEFVESMKRKWGESSPVYAIRVEGNFAKTSSDTVIDLGSVEDAQERELPADNTTERVVITCDVARFGTDETVIAERIGQRVRIVERYVGKRPPSVTVGPQTDDLVATAGRIAEHAGKHPIAHVRIVVDDTGVGGGVTDILRRKPWPVTAFNGGETAFRPDQYPNRRSELWFEGAAQLEDLDLDGDDQLAADLTAPKYTYDLKLRRVVERKEETKKRLGRSPDRADSVLLTLVPASTPGAVERPVAPERGVLTDDELLNMPM